MHLKQFWHRVTSAFMWIYTIYELRFNETWASQCDVLFWFWVRSWAKSGRSWSWSWCRACWTELWTPTCCPGKRCLWIWRSRWSPVLRRGLSTTGYRCLSATAKPPVKTSSGKRSHPANSALNHPALPPHCTPSLPAPHELCYSSAVHIIYTCQTCSIDGLHWDSASVWIWFIYLFMYTIYVFM